MVVSASVSKALQIHHNCDVTRKTGISMQQMHFGL